MLTQEVTLLRDLLKRSNAEQIRQAVMELTPEEAEVLLYDWPLWARDNQLSPDWDWIVWLCLAGRGWGKTRTGAEQVKDWVKHGYTRIALVGRTAADVRDVMIQGESGLLAIYPQSERPKYVESKRRVVWPNGAIATCYSADKPDQLRGPQHDKAWADELASWQYPDAWDQLMFGLRLGDNPQAIVTTTPRPTPIIKKLVADTTTALVRGSTFDNKENLAASFISTITDKYQGTRLGRQELYAEVLDDNPNALWKREDIEKSRLHRVSNDPYFLATLQRVVVAIDPAATSGDSSDDTGIVVAGKGLDGEFYVLKDVSKHDSPNGWAKVALKAYAEFNADRIIGEINNGGEMVEAVIRNVDPYVSYTGVHASRGKVTRAEPIAALYEQGKVHHVGVFPELEDQMCEWTPGDKKSPDRMDALVWALTELSTGVTVSTYGEKPVKW